jgi:D-alanine-D-alanine ligase
MPVNRPRVLLLCGGRSEEHEVSLASARSVLETAGAGFAVTPLVIGRDGRLLPEETSRRALCNSRAPALAAGAETPTGAPKARALELNALDPAAFDVVFPLLHGPFGEDGSVQGLLKLLGLPFVGSDVLGSAVGMDKGMMKAVFAAHGLPQVPYRLVTRNAWRRDPEGVMASLAELGFPVFVKPANLGSSVGIARADDPSGLQRALETAARYDRRVLVERGLIGARELEVGVLGNDAPKASVVGEIRYESLFYDYHTKYTDGEARALIPAPLPPELAARCQALALEAFRAVDAAGLARVDFFLHEGQLYLNEINTMPGFTRTSMFPKLWEATGVPYGTLVARLIELALETR